VDHAEQGCSARTPSTSAACFTLELKPFAVALEADLVDRADLGRRAVGDEIRRQIVHQLGHGRQHRVGADPAELVDAAVAADHDVILDGHVAGQHTPLLMTMWLPSTQSCATWQ
jgi:hypothetical protein